MTFGSRSLISFRLIDPRICSVNGFCRRVHTTSAVLKAMAFADLREPQIFCSKVHRSSTNRRPIMLEAVILLFLSTGVAFSHFKHWTTICLVQKAGKHFVQSSRRLTCDIWFHFNHRDTHCTGLISEVIYISAIINLYEYKSSSQFPPKSKQRLVKARKRGSLRKQRLGTYPR